ncbi:hypothetical protein MMC06_002691 [Schaereria dolodes]|nr:hypothetical protein [Schaereria dolodes]
MHRQALIIAVAALASAVRVLGQTSGNPLNNFIGAAGSAVAAASSAAAKESSSSVLTLTTATSSAATSSSTSTTANAAAAATSSAAASPSGISTKDRLIIIIVCIVVGVLLLLALAGCIYCCLARRRRAKHAQMPIPDDELNTWRRPSNPGREYTAVNGQTHDSGLAQHPTVPDMAQVDRPVMEDHPALRHENPFVPVPPVPRKAVNSRPDLTGSTAPGDEAYGTPRGNYLSKSRSQSRSSSSRGLNDNYIAAEEAAETAADTTLLRSEKRVNRPATPLGFDGLNQPYKGGIEHRIPGAAEPYNPTNKPYGHSNNYNDTSASHPYGYIGQPYEDTHVQVLQSNLPPTELRQSLENRESLRTREPSHQRYSTPPTVPNRSPNRLRPLRDSTYVSNSSDETPSGSGSGSGDSWRTSQMGITPPPNAPWGESRSRANSSPRHSMQGPRVAPWEERDRRYSNSPKGRGESRSPGPSLSGAHTPSRQSMNGGQRRLRFSDFQTEHEHEPWEEHRFSQGVGEAL